MRVLIVNTSERTGGAAVAANRLMKALNNHGIKAKMLVRDKETDTLTVCALPRSPWLKWNFLWERLVIFVRCHFSRQHLFEIDLANTGTDITRLREFQEADIIHLHWINQGMLSLGGIRKILRSGKPVVWTMHDIWPATAICHVTLGCRHFTTRCYGCRLLGKGNGDDLSTTVWQRKLRMLNDENIYFVACSRWLESEAKASAMLKGHKITSIPNPIDTHIYNRYNKKEARERLGLPQDRRLILFSSQRVTTPLKGMDYLIEACRLLGDLTKSQTPCEVVILGGHAEEVVEQLPLKAHPLGYVNEEQRIVDVYNAADVFVLPSLSENLPNTIMEAMACGLPCVGFKVGGIPEEIDHKQNGYVAEYRNAEDLARGIQWILNEADYESLSQNAIQKVVRNYSQQSVALRYAEVYQQAMAFKHYKLSTINCQLSTVNLKNMHITYVTVTFNAAAVLQRTLDSILSQDYPNITHLIIDGASTDGTLQMVDDYIKRSNESENGHLVQVMSEPDHGIYDAMNKGIRSLDGDYVCFLNAGDFLPTPDTVSKIAEQINDQIPAVLYGDTDIVDGEGRFLHHRRLAPPKNLTWKSFRHGMLVCHQAFYARTDFAIATPYDLRYRYSADVDWCIRIMKAAAKERVPLQNLHMVVANYTEEGQTTLHHRESLMERFKIMGRHYGWLTTVAMHCWFVVRSLILK